MAPIIKKRIGALFCMFPSMAGATWTAYLGGSVLFGPVIDVCRHVHRYVYRYMRPGMDVDIFIDTLIHVCANVLIDTCIDM